MATYIVHNDGIEVKTTVTNSATLVDNCITELILSCNYKTLLPPIVALDVEYSEPDNSSDLKAATLQLCSGSRCIIIQLASMETVPPSLANFLAASLFQFVGVGLSESLFRLRRDYGLVVRNAVDIAPVLTFGVMTGSVQLVPRSSSVTSGNWAARDLSIEQIDCAAANTCNLFNLAKDILFA